ncbi:MAG: invasin domain 3-containing protein [Verrucomicrobiota bacterium]
MKKKSPASVLLTLLAVLLSAAAASAATTRTWVPTAGGPWTTVANWSPSGIPVAGDAVVISSAQSANITAVPTIALGSLTVSGNCTLAAAASGNTLTVTNFTLSAGTTLTMGITGARLVFTLAGTGTVNGNFAYDAGATVRNFTVNGTLIVNPSGRVYDPALTAGSVFILSPLANLVIGNAGGISTITTADSTVAINFGGTYSYSANANYQYIGTAAQVTGIGLPTSVRSVTISNISTGVTLSRATTVTNLALVTGTFTDTSLTMASGGAITRAAGTLSVAPTFGVLVNVTYSNGSAVNSGPEIPTSSTVLSNLTINGTAGVTLAAGPTVNSTLTIGTGLTLADGGFTLTAKGAVSNAGTHSGAGKILLAGSAAQALSGVGGYGNLELNNSAGATIGAATTVNGTLTLTAGALANGANLSLANAVTISRDTGTLGSAPTFGSSVNVTYTGTTTVTSGNELPTSTSVLNNLTVNKSGGVTLAASPTVNGTLTLTSGELATGANQVNLPVAAAWARTSGWVNGTLQKAFAIASGQAFTFPIGGALYYRPVSLANLSVTTAGALAARVTSSAGNHPQIAGSGIDPSLDVTRYWTLTADGTLAISGTYDATFNFNAADVSAGANTSYFVIRKYTGSTWSATTTGTQGATSTSATGLSSFSDFVIGDPLASRMLVTLPSQTFTSGAGNSGTVIDQTAGTSFDLKLSAVDIFNAVAPTYGGAKTITYSGPGTSPGGNAPVYTTAVTFANGQAASVATTLKKAEATTITATDDLLTGLASSSLTVVPGTASQLAFTTSPVSVAAAQASSSITIQRRDAFGNPNTADATRSVTLASSSAGTVTFNPVSPLSITSGSSSASFTYNDTKVGTPTLTASSASPAMSVTQQETVILGPVDATLSTLSAGTSSVEANGTAYSTITVTLKDAGLNPVAGKSVSLAKTSGAGSPIITTVLGVTDASGQGSWTVKSTTAAINEFTATDTTDDVPVSQKATVTFTAGAMTHYAVTFSPPPFYTGTPFTTYATAKDAHNNTVTTFAATLVTFSSSSGNMKWDSDGHGSWDKVPTENQILTVNGVATIPTKDDTAAAETGVTLTAGDGTYTGTSAAIDIDIGTDAYRTKASGDWSNYNTVWEKYNGAAWVAATASPTYTDGVISIVSPHTVTVAADVSVDQVHIQYGGSVVVASGKVLTIVNNTLPGLEAYGSLENSGTITVNSGSQLYIYDSGVFANASTVNSGGSYGSAIFFGGTYQHNFTTTAGTIPIASWRSNSQKSTCRIAGYTSNSGAPANLDQNFQNFIWDCSSQGADINLGSSQFTTLDTLTVSHTGSKAIILGASFTLTNTATVSDTASLDCADKVISQAPSGSASYFDLQVGATLGIGSAGGIVAAAGASGNIQTSARHFSGGATYIYNGTTTPQATGSGLPASVHQLTIKNTASSGVVTLSQDLGVNDTFYLTSGALSLGSHTLTIRSAIDATGGGTLTGGASSAIVIGDGVASASTTLPAVSGGLLNLTVARPNGVTLGGAVTVSGAITLTSGTVSSAANLTIASAGGVSITRALGSFSGTPVFSGTAGVTYTAGGVTTGTELPVATDKLQALSFSQASGTVTLAANATANGTVTIGAGAALADGGYTLTSKSSVSNAGTHSGAGKVLLAGSTAQALSGIGSYGNLELNNSAGATVGAATIVNGTLTLTAGELANGTSVTLASGATISRAAGTLEAAPTFGSTVNVIYTGATGVTVANELPVSTSVLNDLTLSYSSPATLTLNASRTVNGTLTLNTGSSLADAGYTLTTKGDVYNYGTHSGAGKIRLDNPASQTLFGSGTYGNLELYQGDAILTGSPIINGTLTLPSAGLFFVVAQTLTLNGPAIAGTPGNLRTTLSSSLVFGGSSASVEIPSSVTELNNLTINNVSGVTMNSTLYMVGTLALTSGKLATGAQILHLNNVDNHSITLGSGWINGTLCKLYAAGNSQAFTYPIGSATTYRPVNLSTMDVIEPGEMDFKVTEGANPSVAGSGLDPAKVVAAYWTVNLNGRLSLANINATWTFVSGDVPAAASYQQFCVRMYSVNASSWYPLTTGLRASTSTAVINASSAALPGESQTGQFVIGDQLASAYRIAANTTTPTPGVADQLTISLVDSLGVTLTDFSGDTNLTFSGLAIADDNTDPTVTAKPGTPVALGLATAITFASGVSSAGGSLVAYKGQGPVTLNATDGSASSTSTGGAGVSLTIPNVNPIAAAHSFARGPGMTLKILQSALVAGATDANHDNISFSTVQDCSGDAAVMASGTLVYYKPGTTASGATFTYTLSDGHSGTGTATATVNVVPSGGMGQQISYSALGVTISFAGMPGYSYDVQRAPDAAFTIDVETLTTSRLAPADGLFTYTDSSPPSPGPSFYRLLQH